MDRRRFCQGILAGAGCLAAPRTGIAVGSNTMQVIDTHQHLWDLDRFRLPWLEGAGEVLRRSYRTDDYREATRDIPVAKAVYMEVDVAVEQQTEEANHLTRLSQSPDHPTVGAVISGRPESPNFAAYIHQFDGNDYIKGIRRIVENRGPGLCLQPQFVKSIQLLGSLGMTFDICIAPNDLHEAVELVKQCPDTRFIIDHCGNADPKAFLSRRSDGEAEPGHSADDWRRDMSRLAEFPNTVCKISGIVVRAPKQWEADHLAPVVNHCLDAWGADRVVFGSDWPVCLLNASLQQWYEALCQIVSSRPEADQQKLFFDNAQQLYRLA